MYIYIFRGDVGRRGVGRGESENLSNCHSTVLMKISVPGVWLYDTIF